MSEIVLQSVFVALAGGVFMAAGALLAWAVDPRKPRRERDGE